jgi:hypothetical protein
VAEPEVEQTAKDFVDASLAARRDLGYSTRVSKKSYGRAVERVARVFDRLRQTTRPTAPGAKGSSGPPRAAR